MTSLDKRESFVLDVTRAQIKLTKAIDTTTGAGTLLSGTGLNSNDSGTVYDAVTNELWDLDVRGDLTTIDPSTFVRTLVGATSSESSGLALIPSTTVPEPSSLFLVGGAALLLLARRR